MAIYKMVDGEKICIVPPTLPREKIQPKAEIKPEVTPEEIPETKPEPKTSGAKSL